MLPLSSTLSTRMRPCFFLSFGLLSFLVSQVCQNRAVLFPLPFAPLLYNSLISLACALGMTLYDDWVVTLFNIAFTSVPPFFIALFEKDLQETTIEKFPQVIYFCALSYIHRHSFTLSLTCSLSLSLSLSLCHYHSHSLSY